MKRQRGKDQELTMIDTSSGAGKSKSDFDIKKFFKAPDVLTNEDFVTFNIILLKFSIVRHNCQPLSFQELVELYSGASDS